MGKPNAMEITEDELTARPYRIEFHMNSGLKVGVTVCFPQNKLAIFKEQFSNDKKAPKWIHQVLPSVTYILNVANIDMVDITPLKVSEEKKEEKKAMKDTEQVEEKETVSPKNEEVSESSEPVSEGAESVTDEVSADE